MFGQCVFGVFLAVMTAGVSSLFADERTETWHRHLDAPAEYAAFPRKVVKTGEYARPEFTVEYYTQANGPDTTQRVLMALPKGVSGKLPAVVVPFYFPEAMLGFNPVNGSLNCNLVMNPRTNLLWYAGTTIHYMTELAKRGYIAVSADSYYLTYAKEGAPAGAWDKWVHAAQELLKRYPDWSGIGKLVFDTRLLIDLLEQDPRVDASRLGIIGHSLGGKMSYYTGCLDPRIKVIVANDPGIGWDQTNWGDVQYWGVKLAEIRKRGLDPSDLLTMSGAKPFCLVAGQYDNADSWTTMQKAKGYEAHPERLHIVNHASGHEPPAWAMEVGYRFLDAYLKPVGSDAFALVESGVPKAAIILTGDRQVDKDIDFFAKAVFRSTGAALKVERWNGGGVERLNGNRIVFKVEPRGMFEEDDWSLTFPDAKTLEIRGSAQSCRWAMNRLLEEYLGVVFCLNGVNGAHHPPRFTFAVPRHPQAGTASLKIERTLYGEDADYLRALGGKEQLPGRQFYNHNMYNIIPPEKYGVDPWREKLMPLLKGQRSKPKSKDNFWQPCFSAAECVPESVKNIRAYLDAHPDEKAYSLTMNDCGGYCECDGCKAMNGGTLDDVCRFGDGKTKCRSVVYFTWANAVAREIAKTHPRVVLGLLAYGATIDPPPFRLEPNLFVLLCGSIYQNGEPRIGEKRRALMRAWSEKVAAYGVWDYPYGPSFMAAPRVYNRRIADFFALKDGPCPSLNGYFGEGAAMFVGEGPKRYLYLKAMFDTKLDVERTLDVWYRACVGEAAAPVLREYYELWEGFWCGEAVKRTAWYKGVDNTYMDFRDTTYLNALDEVTLRRADELLEKAHRLALKYGDAGQKARAERLYAFQRYYSARIRVCGYGADAGNAGDAPLKSPDEAVRFLRRLPSALESVTETARLVERIRVLDEAEQMPAYKWRFPSLARNATMNESLESKMNDAAGFAKNPAVAAELKAARENPSLSEMYRVLLSALSGKRGYPPIVDEDASELAAARQAWIRDSIYGVTVTEKAPDAKGRVALVATSKDGTWPALARIVMGNKKPLHYFRFAARVRNTSSVKLRVRMCRDALGARPVTNIFEIEPGATRTMAVIGQMGYKGGYDRFFMIFNGLPKGERVEIEGLSIDDIGLLTVDK